MKIPMHVNLRDQWENTMTSSVFDSLFNFAVFGQYFTVLWEVIVKEVCFKLALHQNKPRAANFGEKDEFIMNLADCSNFFFFWSSSAGLFWPFLGGQCIPNTKIWAMPTYIIVVPGHQSKNDHLYQSFLPIRLCYSQKSIFDIFRGPKWPPLRPRDLKTSRCGA